MTKVYRKPIRNASLQTLDQACQRIDHRRRAAAARSCRRCILCQQARRPPALACGPGRWKLSHMAVRAARPLGNDVRPRAPRVSVPDAAGTEQRTTPAELFWDLVFVFAVTQVTTLLHTDLSWAGFGRAMLVLALVWWAWSAFVWAMNAHDPDELRVRGVLFLAMIFAFLVALSVPRAFGEAAMVFALAYAGVRLLHLALYVAASRRGNARLAAIAGFAATVAISMALLLAGSVVGDPARTWLWVTAAASGCAGSSRWPSPTSPSATACSSSSASASPSSRSASGPRAVIWTPNSLAG